MIRSAAIMVDERALRGLEKDKLTELLVPAIDGLPAHHRLQFLNLSTHDTPKNYADQIHKIYSTNAFRTPVDKDPEFHSTFVERKWQVKHGIQLDKL